MTDNPSSAGMINAFDAADLASLDTRMQGLVKRRRALLGPAYRLFYRRPVELVRGDGVHVFDADGRRYIDAYNNVPSVGHSNPRVAEAVSRQLSVLNTHTRYAGEPILDYAERLVATHASGIDAVMFTCTGSEANDLALRIARHATGGTGVIVTRNAYHGLTSAVAEISPSLGAAVPLGAHVRNVPPPDPSRGDAAAVGAHFAEGVARAIEDLERHGFRTAALVVDSILSTDGIIPDPAGFLRPAAELVRGVGGLYVADEVQTGFARTGTMWGYQRHGLSPDLVVMGKPMGNGLPIGGVAARTELLEQFGATIRYFNTFGGNDVCIAAATAVLDEIEARGFVEHSGRMGAYLVDGIERVANGRADVARARGAGLFVAVDFVDPETGRPDPARAAHVVDAMRERCVLVSATGIPSNSLKIRPPLPFAEPDAHEFLEVFGDVLAELPETGGVAR